MPSTINASTSAGGGIIQTADASGDLALQGAGVTGLTINANQKTIIASTTLATPSAGMVEYDGTAFYSSMAASTRGVMPSEQIIVLTSTNTLTSQTAVQPIFDGGGGPTNGQVTLPIGTYQYELSFAMTNLETVSSGFGFNLGGTATKTFSYNAAATKGINLLSGGTVSQTYGSAASTQIGGPNTNPAGVAFITGIIRVTVAGTIIPQTSLTVASAAVA
jgi:hypothetical protein